MKYLLAFVFVGWVIRIIAVIAVWWKDCKEHGKENLAVPLKRRLRAFFYCFGSHGCREKDTLNGPKEQTYLSVTNKTGGLVFIAAPNEPCEIKLQWESMRDGIRTGDGVLSLIVNGRKKFDRPVEQGCVKVDVGPYVSEQGGVAKIGITDEYGLARWIRFTIYTTDPKAVSAFDAFEFGDIDIPEVKVNDERNQK